MESKCFSLGFDTGTRGQMRRAGRSALA